MAYVLAGLIAPTSAGLGLGPATELLPLRQEFVIRPLAHRFLIDGTSLPTDVSAAAARASLRARVVYVEAESTPSPIAPSSQEEVVPPEPTRWGVSGVGFVQPMCTHDDARRNLAAILPGASTAMGGLARLIDGCGLAGCQ